MRAIQTAWKADWRLVPKSEEEAFLSAVKDTRKPNVIPRYVEYPPLMEYLMRQQGEAAGKPVTEKPLLEIRIGKSKNNIAALEEMSQS